ncbi:MAG: FAD-dependent oxidoreductase [Thermodesulfovibrionales bacterium]|nr:FAD-dependent oxidoreductase [Thermodesulfovibrionales bacterium]
MAEHDFDIGIIGGGAAGLTVASGASQLGAKVLLIEKEKALGGDCLHYGCVPSKTLIRTARVRHLMGRAGDFGLPHTELAPVDFREVSARIRDVISVIQKHDSVERFCSLGAKVEFGDAEFMDEHSVRLGGRTVSARQWVIATGSSPMVPDIAGLNKTPYITNKEIFSLEKLPPSMVVLGGGPIAVELSQAMARLGTEVTILQRSPQLLGREDRDMADMALACLEASGVKVYTNTGGIHTEDKGTHREVRFMHGGYELTVKADTILVALGRSPNSPGLRLENAGVETDANGWVQVDPRMRTSQRHIYAAGDAIGAYQFTHAAGYEGGIIVANAVFRLPRRADYTWMPHCTYIDPELAGIGMSENDAKRLGKDYSVWTEKFQDNDRALAEGEPEGKIKLLLDAKERPIGVQIFGAHAGELINEWVAAMAGKVKPSALAGAIHPYPTMGEINKRVAGGFLSKKLFSDRVRKGLKLVFNLKGRACGPVPTGTPR